VLFIATVTALGRDAPIRPGGPVSTTVGLITGTALAAVVGLGLTKGAAVATRGQGDPGLGAAVQDALPDTGVEHPVTGVLLNLRSLDTLMEMVVLLAAVAVALIVLPENRGGQRVAVSRDASEAILDHFVRLSAPLLILVAAWLLVAGSSRPGGAFQSGAVLAATLILLHLGGVWRLSVRPLLLLVLAGGVAAFLVVAVAGLLSTGSWLELRGPAAGPVILVLEAVLAVTIGASLATVFLAASSPIGRQQVEGR
jgi:multisubunit Na+/H+ antiporter MnhB subunit